MNYVRDIDAGFIINLQNLILCVMHGRRELLTTR